MGQREGVIGKPVLESFPEVTEQGFIDLLDKVRTTGNPFQIDEFAVWYDYDGEKVQKYVTLLYQSYLEAGTITMFLHACTTALNPADRAWAYRLFRRLCKIIEALSWQKAKQGKGPRSGYGCRLIDLRRTATVIL